MLARVKPVPRTGRVALLASCSMMLLLVVGFTGLCAGLNVLGALLASPAVAVLSMFLAVICAIPHSLVILWLDRNEREPWWLLATAFLWGAVVATGLSLIANMTFGAFSMGLVGDEAVANQLTASISAPFAEELTKGFALVVLYLFFRRELDTVLDGIVYGALVGLGFAVFENFIYYVNTGNLGGVVVLALLRGVITGMGSHASFTAITGAGIGAFRVLRTGVLRWLLPPLALALAMFVHFSWNTFTSFFIIDPDDPLLTLFVSMPVAVLVLQMPFLALVLIVATVAGWHENKLISTYLKDEQEAVVTPGELAELVPYRRRVWAQTRRLLTLRIGAWWRARVRHNLQVGLAFEKWHMAREDELASDADAQEHARRVVDLRRRLRALPSELA